MYVLLENILYDYIVLLTNDIHVCTCTCRLPRLPGCPWSPLFFIVTSRFAQNLSIGQLHCQWNEAFTLTSGKFYNVCIVNVICRMLQQYSTFKSGIREIMVKIILPENHCVCTSVLTLLVYWEIFMCKMVQTNFHTILSILLCALIGEFRKYVHVHVFGELKETTIMFFSGEKFFLKQY